MSAPQRHRIVWAIAAVDRNGAIGYRGRLLCHLPDDLRRFKALTLGHTVVMGRKTFESLPAGPLKNRRNIVITRRLDFAPEGVTVVHSLDEALACGGQGEVIVIGGEQVYAQALPRVSRLYLTVIDHAFEQVDAWFPHIDTDHWTVTDRVEHPADERHPFAFTFLTLERATQTNDPQDTLP